jgi:hypothetical protein
MLSQNWEANGKAKQETEKKAKLHKDPISSEGEESKEALKKSRKKERSRKESRAPQASTFERGRRVIEGTQGVKKPRGRK